MRSSLRQIKVIPISYRLLPAKVPKIYWAACRSPETESDKYVLICSKWLNEYSKLDIEYQHLLNINIVPQLQILHILDYLKFCSDILGFAPLCVPVNGAAGNVHIWNYNCHKARESIHIKDSTEHEGHNQIWKINGTPIRDF